MNKTNTNVNPTNIKLAREHRPLRFVVRQWVNEEGQRYQINTGYHSSLEKIPGMPSTLNMALDNIHRFGGELWADYGSADMVLIKGG